MPEVDTLGAMVRRARQKRGVSLKNLSLAVREGGGKISEQYLSRLERGDNATEKLVRQLAAALGFKSFNAFLREGLEE